MTADTVQAKPAHRHCPSLSPHEPHDWTHDDGRDPDPLRHCCGAWPVAPDCELRGSRWWSLR